MFFRDMRGPLKTSEPLFLRTLRAPMLYRDTRSPMFYRDMRSPMYYREMGPEPLVLRSQKDLEMNNQVGGVCRDIIGEQPWP